MLIEEKAPKKETGESGEKKTLWVVSELYYPEMTSTGYYMTKIAEGLTDSFDVKAICGQPNYLARGTSAPRREVCNNVEVFRVFGTTLDKNILIFKLINMITLSVSVFFEMLYRFRKNDHVLVVTNPPTMPFIAALSCVVKKADYTLLIHDNYPEILIAAGKAGEGSLFVNIINKFNEYLYRRVRKIIVVGRDMERLVRTKLDKIRNGGAIPIAVIQNWAELEQVEPGDRENNTLLDELGIKDKFVFLYAGNMGYPNDLESLIEAAENLKNDSRLHFVFLGTGVKRKWLEKTVLDKALRNVTLLDPMPRSRQKVFLNACDVAIVSLIRKMWGVSMPSRTYNIMAAGKPIFALTEDGSEVARVIEEEQIGWIAPPNDAKKTLSAIYKIYDERGTIAEKGYNARKAAEKKYSLEAAVDKYKRVLDLKASDNEMILIDKLK